MSSFIDQTLDGSQTAGMVGARMFAETADEPTDQVRVGIMFKRHRVDRQAAELTRWLAEHRDLHLVQILVAEPGSASALDRPPGADSVDTRSPIVAALMRWVARGIAWIEQSMVRRRYGDQAEPSPTHVDALIGPARIMALADAGLGGRLDADQLNRLRKLDIDVLIDWDANLPASTLARCTNHGVLSPRYGHDRRRSLFDGMDDVTRGASVSHFDIVWTPADLAPAASVAQGACHTQPFWLVNQVQLRRRASAHLKRLLGEHRLSRDAWRRRRLAARADNLTLSIRRLPGHGAGACAVRLTAYLARSGWRHGGALLARLAGRRDEWKLSVVRAGWRGADYTTARMLTAPKGHFWADPFLAREADQTVLFVEDYVYATGIAHISALAIDGDDVRPLGPVLREPFHLSFPYVFRDGGNWYMCPESSAAGDIRLYECTDFPIAWRLKTVLMTNVSAADTVLFARDGRWWMLTNIDPTGGQDHCEELYLFHRASLLEGDWVSHPMNPLKVDAEGGRNGGLILESDGRIYRVAQRQGFRRYGYGSTIYEITRLDEQHYVEREVSRIDADFRAGVRGTHHLSSIGDVTVIDHVGGSFFP